MANKLPEWVVDLVRNVPTDLVRDVVNDNRGDRPLSGATPKVQIQGAGTVTTGDGGPKYRPYQPTADDTDRSGWRDAPQLKPPPGLEIIDAMVAAQDERDLVQRANELAAAQHARALVETEIKQREAEAEGKSKERGGKK
jgi:hypothetical protein